MARLNSAAAGGGCWPAATMTATDVRSTGRRGWLFSAWLVAITIALAIASYSISVRVAAEKRQADRFAAANRSLEADLKALNAELRVRMRLPQLQRWNDETFGLVPISAHQYLATPHSLAAYGNELPQAAPPKVTYAIRDVAPSAGVAAPRMVLASAPAATRPVAERPAREQPLPPQHATPERAAPARTPKVILAAAPKPAAAPAIERPHDAPADLLRQVAMLADGQPPAEH